jgi:hypothetical protein
MMHSISLEKGVLCHAETLTKWTKRKYVVAIHFYVCVLACPKFSENFKVCAIYLPTYSFTEFSFSRGTVKNTINTIHTGKKGLYVHECPRKMPHIRQ